MRKPAITGAFIAVFLASAPSALAEWRYQPNAGLAGQASVVGSEGTTFMVDCGNSGAPAFFFTRGAPWIGDIEDGQEISAPIYVDRSRIGQVISCFGNQCELKLDYDAAVAAGKALARGNELGVVFRTMVLERFSLKGSAAALSSMRRAGCET